MFKKSVVLMALVASTFAADTIRNKLGQVNAKNLAQEAMIQAASPASNWCNCATNLAALPAVSLPTCPCTFTPLPGLGAGLNNRYNQAARVEQGQLVESVPDTQFTQICQSNCCACEEEAHAAYSNAVKNRTFSISGSISVLETLAIQEMGQGEQNSQGYSEKDTICETNNASGGLGAGN